MSIAVSHADGDTIGIVSCQKTLSEGVHSCVGMVVAAVYGKDTEVAVSPSEEGEDFIKLVTNLDEDYIVVTLCAARIKITGNGKVVVRS